MIGQKPWMHIMVLAVLMLFSQQAVGKDVVDTLVMNRIYNYRKSVGGSLEGMTTLAYLKYRLRTDRRNKLLFFVPHLHVLARSDDKDHLYEIFSQFVFHEDGTHEMEQIAQSSSFTRRRRSLLNNVQSYLLPRIYNEMLYSDHLLSPFNRRNSRFYRYEVHNTIGNQLQITFKPQAANTQTVRGQAIVDKHTGRVISCTLMGEYDMVSFELRLQMGEQGLYSLIPLESHLKSKFTFLGNKIRGIHEAKFQIPIDLPRPNGVEDHWNIMEQYRPDSLEEEEKMLYFKRDSVIQSRTKNDTVRIRKKNFAKDVLWGIFGENLLQRIKGNFDNDKGYYRLSPILNPLYVGYSERRGFTYRFTLRGGYVFSPNSEIRTRIKLGYSFKLKQFQINVPITFYFDKNHNGYLEAGWRSGEHQTNSTIIDKLRTGQNDTIDWKKMNLDYFRHTKQHLTVHYDFTPYFGIEAGYLFNRWKSVDGKHFDTFNKPKVYQSTSLMCEFRIRPLGYQGPIISVNYERTAKKLSKKGMNYEKWEYDCSYLYRMPLMRSLSLRAGAGYYSTQTEDAYFLDFNNFRDDNIPGGWIDEWSGEFELLHRNWYNSSKYYVRLNATYESPLILLSWVPLVGNIVEKERFYFSALRLSALSNYMEVGYGFTNRLCSVGIFTSFKRFRYEALGFKFGFELFNKW